MSYEVLARKLRPAGFDALVGQDHVVRALQHALDHDRLHHAYLFTGTRGVGKTTIARILAKALNCEKGVSATPCEACSVCLEVKENRFVDLIEVDAASRTGVDDTRDLLENAQYLPTRGRYKVYLVDEVHMLSTASFNALLKTLEEPPEHVKFLLATTDPKKVPVTVLSRCLQFQLKNLSKEAIASYLREVLEGEGVATDEVALEVIARSAAGSMRDALSLTDQAIAYGQGSLKGTDVVEMLGVVGRDEVAVLLAALASGSAERLMALTAELAERNADFSDVLKGMLEALHRAAVDHSLGKSSEHLFDAETLHLLYQIALIGSRDLSLAPDERSGFEMTLLRMLAFSPMPDSQVPPLAGKDDVAASVPPEAATLRAAPEGPGAADAPDDGGSIAQSRNDASPTVAGGPIVEMPDEKPPTTESGDAWADVVAVLDIGGVVRMIAENSVPRVYAPPSIELLLDQGHDTLLSDPQVGILERALTAHTGGAIKLTIEVGELPAESPAQRRDRLAREAQADAEAAIGGDANVQELLAEFGGRVEEIRPI